MRTNEELEKENTFLRGLVAKLNIPCVYCGLENMSCCSRGFPGCAKADDILCADDEFMRQLLEENRQLKKQV